MIFLKPSPDQKAQALSARRRKWLVVAIAAVLTAPLITGQAVAANAAASTTWHVDCSSAADGTGTSGSPIRSIAAANALELRPGDTIAFKRGVICQGQFAPQGSGTADSLITIGAYGDGTARPRIDAGGAENAVLLNGTAYITVKDLELTAQGDNRTARRGVYVYAKDAGVVPGISLINLEIHDVRGYMPSVLDPLNAASFVGKGPRASGGIVIEAQGTTVPTAFHSLRVERNDIHDVDRQGIYTWTNWCKRPMLDNWRDTLCFADWFPSTGMVFRDNKLRSIGGDGAVMKGVDGGLMEGNTLAGFNERAGSYNAGFWTANSNNITIKRNEASGGVGTLDSQGYDVDHATRHVVIEQNLSHDNEGGFLLMCPTASGNEDWIVRNNISWNDDERLIQHGCGGPVRRGLIENNTFYMDAGIDPVVYWGTRPLDVKIRNNIIVKERSELVPFTIPAGMTVENNLLDGISAPAAATGTIPGPAKLIASGAFKPQAYRLQPDSPAIGAGAPPALAGADYFGAPTPATRPNVGAYQGPGLLPTVANGCVPDIEGEPAAIVTTIKSINTAFKVTNRCSGPLGQWMLQVEAPSTVDLKRPVVKLTKLDQGESQTYTWQAVLNENASDGRHIIRARLRSNGPEEIAARAEIHFRDVSGWSDVTKATFDGDIDGSAPSGWTTVGPTPPTVNTVDGKKSLVLSWSASATNSAVWPMGTSAENSRVIATVRANQSSAALGMHLVNSVGQPVARLSLNGSGGVSYTNGSSFRDTGVRYPVGSWTRLEAVTSGTNYSIYLDDVRVGGGSLERPGPVSLRLQIPASPGSAGASFAVDSVVVQSKK